MIIILKEIGIYKITQMRSILNNRLIDSLSSFNKILMYKMIKMIKMIKIHLLFRIIEIQKDN